MKKSVLLLALLAFFVPPAAHAQVEVHFEFASCNQLQDDPSCTPAPRTYTDGEGNGVVWAMECSHSEVQAFSCPFNWPPGAALTGDNEIFIEVGTLGPSGNGETTSVVCHGGAIICRESTGSGDEELPLEVSNNSVEIQLAVKSVKNTSEDSFVHRWGVGRDPDDINPGATGARCELIIKRLVGEDLEFFGCNELSSPLGYEYGVLRLPAE